MRSPGESSPQRPRQGAGFQGLAEGVSVSQGQDSVSVWEDECLREGWWGWSPDGATALNAAKLCP